MAECVVDQKESSDFCFGSFSIGKPLGKGAFGAVFLAKHSQDDYLCALKVYLFKELIESRMQKQVLREIEIMSELDHPNILKLHDFFSDDEHICLILEYAAHGDLYSELSKHGYFDERRGATYIYQMADALNYCHSKSIIHRDLKPENIMVGYFKELKLADFGWSVRSLDVMRSTFCGTADYVAPEILSNNILYDCRVDSWSLGVLCFELLSGNPPFDDDDRQLKYQKIQRASFKIPSHFSLGAQSLIEKLLVTNETKRMALKEVLDNDWIKSNFDDQYTARLKK